MFGFTNHNEDQEEAVTYRDEFLRNFADVTDNSNQVAKTLYNIVQSMGDSDAFARDMFTVHKSLKHYALDRGESGLAADREHIIAAIEQRSAILGPLVMKAAELAMQIVMFRPEAQEVAEGIISHVLIMAAYVEAGCPDKKLYNNAASGGIQLGWLPEID